MRKFVPVLSVLFAFVVAGTTSAHNWRADPSNLATWCSANAQSECTADNQYHYVWIASGVPTNIQNAFLTSLHTDYTFGGVDGVLGDSFPTQSGADVELHYENVPAGNPAAYTTCSPFATFGASGWNRYCKRQLIELDSIGNAWADGCFGSPSTPTGCINWVACHELGHTMGLQHDTRSGSCMNKEGPDGTQSKNLDGHDMEHLADCYPKTNDYYLTTDCDTYQGHY